MKLFSSPPPPVITLHYDIYGDDSIFVPESSFGEQIPPFPDVSTRIVRVWELRGFVLEVAFSWAGNRT